jgi:DNA repair protein NreA
MIRGKAEYLKRLAAKMRFKSVKYPEKISGSSPPSVFIGSWNYPKVFVGPLIPQLHGDTSMMDTPELWLNTKKQAADIMDFRFQLIRGKSAMSIFDLDKAQPLQEIALAKKSMNIEAEFTQSPRGIFLNEDVQPFGPSGLLKTFSVGNEKLNPLMEKAYYDTDLKARDAMLNLYDKGIVISSIQKALSVGAFGLGKSRKLVPTRWSITAVDDTLSKFLLDKVRHNTPISEYRVYEAESINNKFVVIMLPGPWRYESMEAFFPDIIGRRMEIYSDYEQYDGKKDYALIGGCYYSARLAIAEELDRKKEQAGAIVLREAYPGYVPLGVWNVRENMRMAMASTPKRFESLEQTMWYVSTRLRVPVKEWIGQSRLFKSVIAQRTMRDYQKK